jgi:hypothetical protein
MNYYYKIIYFSIILKICCSKLYNHKCTSINYDNISLETHTNIFSNLYENKTYSFDIIYIPIVWHIIFRKERGNISKDLLELEVNRINNDFNLNNEDRYNTPLMWRNRMANFKLNFSTNQIIRKQVNILNWDINNDIKYDSKGGSNAVETNKKLNIWIVNLAPLDRYIILGYAQFPGQYYDFPETDGIVLNIKYFLYYNYTRTLTHEIGHWLNLKHIWGEPKDNENYTDGCNYDDNIDDTPLSQYPHYSNIGFPNTKSCGTADMYMNFMDYGNSRVMFTKGQLLRSRAIFEKNHPRYDFVNDDDHDDAELLFIIILIIFLFICMIFVIICIKNMLLRALTENN